MVWSHEPLKNALAAFYPVKSVPEHKFTTNQGRVELKRQANLGVHKKRYFDGWCEFVKAGKAFNSTFVTFTDAVVITLHLKGDEVQSVSKNHTVELETADAVALAAKGNTSFTGTKKMAKTAFSNKLTGESGSIITM